MRACPLLARRGVKMGSKPGSRSAPCCAPGDDAAGGILQVERVRQLLPRGVQRRPVLVRLQHQRVPLLRVAIGEHAASTFVLLVSFLRMLLRKGCMETRAMHAHPSGTTHTTPSGM